MHKSDSTESVATKSRADDTFFVIATVVLPFLAEGAYLFDVFYYHTHVDSSTGYEGLLSTILCVFIYLQYSAPLRSRYIRFLYHLILWMLSEVGTIAHVVYYAKKHDKFHVILYVLWAVLDSVYFVCLVYCRVFSKHHGLRVHMPLEQEHLFHFISRLEVILAIFIPVFFDTRLVTLTRDNIAFYILFDFFAESYHRFSGVTIRATLYVFVIAVTASVATEWIHIANHKVRFEIASLVCELVAACLCYALIVMQFFPGNFLARKKRKHHRVRSMLSSITTTHTYDARSELPANSKETSPPEDVCHF